LKTNDALNFVQFVEHPL